MRILYLWISVIAIAGIVGAAALTNDVNVKSGGIGIFGWDVICLDNGGGYFCNTVSDETGDTQLLVYEDPDMAGDDFSTGIFGSTEGCSPEYWDSISSQAVLSGVNWPVGYLPEDKFSSPAYFNTQIAISLGNDPTLQESLQADGDGINKLARHASAAVLNSAHKEINYPITIIDIISNTQASIDNQEYSFADVLASYNNLGKETVCEKVE